MNKSICWASVDPVRCKVDFYPAFIAEKIETAYKNKEDKCELGADFFNATVHLNNDYSTNFYQTTTQLGSGRFGIKPSGYRTVKRVILDSSKRVIIHAKKVHSEWRMIDDNDLQVISNIKTFNELVPDTSIIIESLTNEVNYEETLIEAWKPEDLQNKEIFPNKNVIVWLWCRGIPEKQGNIMELSNEWWCPYSTDLNQQIENAFDNKNTTTDIIIPFDNTVRQIIFEQNSSYAKQVDHTNKKSRLVKRIIITISHLDSIFINQIREPLNINDLEQYIANQTIPYEFICGISQDIMSDPVKTCDGFTYDRYCIERWLETSNKSPMTGLDLDNKILVTNNAIRNQIEHYINSLKDNNGNGSNNSTL